MTALLLVFAVGALKGAQDHLMFHTSSPEPDWAVPYWGDAKRVYLRRYEWVGGQRVGTLAILEVPVVGGFLKMFWDGWHLVALLRALAAAAIVACAPPALPVGATPLAPTLGLAFALHTAGFYLTYTTLPRLT